MKVNEVARLESDLAKSRSEGESLRVYVDRMADEITDLNNDLHAKS
jgi:cell division protein FtsB